ncbi:uncharacterized protein LOC124286716 [Haliotis rubra]|uniref:uncharacterized protein LOC124286716 n=1 Tax=Haliotis rubra TaxID=36100 RepID=UPI001EE5FC1B|nr:uncharacterized protein LOC124286716 [Haliotis rubra]
MCVILLLVCLVGVGQSATPAPPKPCCTDREFKVTLGEAGGAMYKVNGHYVQNFIQGYNVVYYDSYNEMMAVEAVIFSNGTKITSHLVQDYPKKSQYLITKDGTCTRYAMTRTFRKPCIPDDSEFDGYSYMGYGTEELPLVSWRYRQPGTDHIIKLTVTKEGCVPIIENIFGHYQITNISEPVVANTMFLMVGFQPSIGNRDAFKIPSGCTSSTDTIPQPVGRSLRGVHALFAN